MWFTHRVGRFPLVAYFVLAFATVWTAFFDLVSTRLTDGRDSGWVLGAKCRRVACYRRGRRARRSPRLTRQSRQVAH